MKTKYVVQDAYGFYLTFTNRANQGGKQPGDGDLFDTRQEAEAMVKLHREGDVVAVADAGATVMKITIDIDKYGDIVARNPDGDVLAKRTRSYNPAALHQLVSDAKELGDIDWENSQVAKPDWEAE